MPSCHGPCWPFLPHPSWALLPRLIEFRGYHLSYLEFSTQLFSLPPWCSLSSFPLSLGSSITFCDRPSQLLGLSSLLVNPASSESDFTLLTLCWCDHQHLLSLPVMLVLLRGSPDFLHLQAAWHHRRWRERRKGPFPEMSQSPLRLMILSGAFGTGSSPGKWRFLGYVIKWW